MNGVVDRGMIRVDYSFMLSAGPSCIAMYNAHMAVPNAGSYSQAGHCRICDGKPYTPGTSAAYTLPVAEADLLGLFEEKLAEKPASPMADLMDIFASSPATISPSTEMDFFGDAVPASVPVAVSASVPVAYTPASVPVSYDSVARLRMPVQPLDKISEMATRQMIPQYEAEAVIAFLYPKDGYNKNTLLALQVINRIARENGMTRYDAEMMLRE